MGAFDEAVRAMPDEALKRYGVRWMGAYTPICVPMDDGYWTPWHVANEEVARLTKALDDARRQYRPVYGQPDTAPKD